ncbi:hypothetical protein [Actinoplanes sp. HUAS TT8]|uniref:hypothetical protein n=1 Tax=Actinoplanes sp. HUAS TT8 TaxID=3447453 RepID=UPI003F521B60
MDVQELRRVAIERLVGRPTGSDTLIRIGLDALLSGVQAPSLPLLAGLTRAEEPEAPELFDRVVAELRLLPENLPTDQEARTRALVLWWAGLIVDGTLPVHSGGHYIYWYGGQALPDELLRPLIGAIARYDDECETSTVGDTERPARLQAAEAEVVEKAKALLERRAG